MLLRKATPVRQLKTASVTRSAKRRACPYVKGLQTPHSPGAGVQQIPWSR